MIISSVCIFILVCYQNYVYKKTQSYIVKVDKFHNFVDLLTNLSVIISLKISINLWFIDLIFAILISIYLLYGCIKLFRKALKNLLDHEFDKTEKQKILNIIRQNTQVLGVHELKTRYAGNKAFIQCHLEVDGNMTLLQAHEIAEDISTKIEQAFPDCEVLIHQDPAGYEQSVMYQEKI
ncbi:cation diffusion facilitator transporter family protein [Orientia chuto str. Dubai]|uniref:Protein p34 n=1 Tax=Orientia chuto str. Dubai TaxID=1359168 RepID=A0A0F3MLU1_9RICK|nr:cation diffusion facilitator transporter family protein [Orientia chuto str. Dubai]